MNDFTSDRKRMSVIVKHDGGKHTLYVKGADNVVLPLCTNAVTAGFQDLGCKAAMTWLDQSFILGRLLLPSRSRSLSSEHT